MPLIMLFLNLSVAVFVFLMPPATEKAILPLIVQFVNVSVPSFQMPPPCVSLPLVIIMPAMFTVCALLILKIL